MFTSITPSPQFIRIENVLIAKRIINSLELELKKGILVVYTTASTVSFDVSHMTDEEKETFLAGIFTELNT